MSPLTASGGCLSCAGGGGAGTGRSHCRFPLPLIHCITDSLTYSAPPNLTRPCDQTLGRGRAPVTDHVGHVHIHAAVARVEQQLRAPGLSSTQWLAHWLGAGSVCVTVPQTISVPNAHSGDFLWRLETGCRGVRLHGIFCTYGRSTSSGRPPCESVLPPRGDAPGGGAATTAAAPSRRRSRSRSAARTWPERTAREISPARPARAAQAAGSRGRPVEGFAWETPKDSRFPFKLFADGADNLQLYYLHSCIISKHIVKGAGTHVPMERTAMSRLWSIGRCVCTCARRGVSVAVIASQQP
jgi:hypothetical protein